MALVIALRWSAKGKKHVKPSQVEQQNE